MTETSADRPATLIDYLAVLRRRKWIIFVPVLAALVGFQFSSSQPSVYQAQAKVLVNRSSLVGAVTGIQDPAAYDSARYLTTQANIARSPELAARVAAAEGVPRMTAGAVLAASNVTPEADSDLLNVSVSYRSPRDAVVLVNAYADEFTRYKTELDTAQINDAVRTLEADAARLRKSGETRSPAYERLIEDQSRLATIGRLVANSTKVLQPAAGAAKIEPRPRRALVLGGLLGAVLALGLAFLAEALDRRVRTEGEIEELLGLPLLGRIPRPPPALRKKNRLVMLAEPMGVHAEAFRKLWGAIEFVKIQRGAAARTIMFTSALQREGKSTTVANLAIALARSGQRVALVDLDLRRPFLHSFFGIPAEPGFTDVVVGRESLNRAVRHLSLPTAGGLESLGERNGQPSAPSSVPNDPSDVETSLLLLPCGTIPPAAGEFLGSERVSALLHQLREQFEVVLVDAPPLTVVGDAMTLSAAVDGIVVVASLGIERTFVDKLARELQNCRAATLGLVLTGVPHSDAYAYGHRSYDHGYRGQVPPATRRGRQPLFGGLLRKAPTGVEAPHAQRDEGRGTADADTSRREDVTQADGRA